MNTAKEIAYVFLNSDSGKKIIVKTHQTKELGGVVATIETYINGVKSELATPVRRNGVPFDEADFTTFATTNNYTLEKTINGVKTILNAETTTVTFTVTDGSSPINGASVVFNGGSPVLTNSSGIAVITGVVHGSAYAYSVTKTAFTTVNGTTNVNAATAVSVVMTAS